ncbi:hypothetical protein [Pararhizobium sp.]|uniref:hypothetical protein n=1 Tax=Pararhizobium sp. TaxID=1977563 RepID=UPI00272552DC|nr:hypothetical protein [Pararhizobium sp.]MDO9414898.1 hypothetical protein [Pararhizobium sp.]
MSVSLMSRFAAGFRALNTRCLWCLVTGNRSCAGAFAVQEMSDDRKRDIGLLDGRSTYRRS